MRGSIIAGLVLATAGSMALAADSVTMTAGRWTETITVTSVNIGGKPLTAAQIGLATTKAICMSPAEAIDPRTFFQARGGSSDCAEPAGTVDNGRLALVSTCRKGGDPIVIEVKGDYGAQTYNSAIRAQSSGGANQLLVTLTATGRYDGACKGDEEK